MGGTRQLQEPIKDQDQERELRIAGSHLAVAAVKATTTMTSTTRDGVEATVRAAAGCGMEAAARDGVESRSAGDRVESSTMVSREAVEATVKTAVEKGPTKPKAAADNDRRIGIVGVRVIVVVIGIAVAVIIGWRGDIGRWIERGLIGSGLLLLGLSRSGLSLGDFDLGAVLQHGGDYGARNSMLMEINDVVRPED